MTKEKGMEWQRLIFGFLSEARHSNAPARSCEEGWDRVSMAAIRRSTRHDRKEEHTLQKQTGENSLHVA